MVSTTGLVVLWIPASTSIWPLLFTLQSLDSHLYADLDLELPLLGNWVLAKNQGDIAPYLFWLVNLLPS
jgi:hypothetical protein